MLNLLHLTFLLCIYATGIYTNIPYSFNIKNEPAPAAVMTFQLFVDSPRQAYNGLDASIKNEHTGVTYTPQSFQIAAGKGVFQFGVAGEVGEVFSLTVRAGSSIVASGSYTVTAINTQQHYVATTIYMSY